MTAAGAQGPRRGVPGPTEGLARPGLPTVLVVRDLAVAPS